jgi:hypothetical protein
MEQEFRYHDVLTATCDGKCACGCDFNRTYKEGDIFIVNYLNSPNGNVKCEYTSKNDTIFIPPDHLIKIGTLD